MIRLSTFQIHQQGIRGLLDVQQAVSKTQGQIATGKNFLTAGDDPVAATRVMQLSQELRLSSQYERNANVARNRLEREDVALSNIGDLLQRAQELVIQSGNAALDAQQRSFIGVEMEGVVESMVQLMNSRDANGEYLFAGMQSSTPPFSKGSDGRYRFEGDAGERRVQIGLASFIESGDSGRHLFVDLDSAESSLSASASTSNSVDSDAVISAVTIRDREELTQRGAGRTVIEFRPLDEVEPNTLNYSVVQQPEGRIVSSNQPYQEGQDILLPGASVRISGKPVPGDSFSVVASKSTALLTTLQNFTKSLNDLGDDAASRSQLNTEVEVALGNLEIAQTRQLEVQSSVGARLNRLDASISNNEDVRLATQATLSELQDLDYASAVSQLSQESFILEAAQASFARISGLSLFNYL